MICDVPISPPQNARGTWRDAVETPLMVELPSGEFVMGENDGDKFANDTERPAHRVQIPPGLALGCFPVTAGEFRHFRPAHAPDDTDDLPVVHVNWHDAHAYCDWLRNRTGRVYRLPGEAEWEFACRAGTSTRFHFGNDEGPLGDYAWFSGNSASQIHAVGEKKANGWGFYDMHGNVWEWCWDTYGERPQTGAAGAQRVNRGGSWGSFPVYCRSAVRGRDLPTFASDNLGFRIARSLPE